MLQTSRGKWTGAVLVLGGLLAAIGVSTPSLAAGPRAKRPDPTQTGRVDPPVEEYKSSGDPDENTTKLLKEKLDLLRQREEYMSKAFQAKKVVQKDLDGATLEVLRAELGVLEKPTLRIATREKIMTILKHEEALAEQDWKDAQAKMAHSQDINALISASGKYTGAKIRRIDAELDLERERSALQKEMGSQSADAKK